MNVFETSDSYTGKERSENLGLRLDFRDKVNVGSILLVQILGIPLNPYLGHFGNAVERHLWTKNPHIFFSVIVNFET